MEVVAREFKLAIPVMSESARTPGKGKQRALALLLSLSLSLLGSLSFICDRHDFPSVAPAVSSQCAIGYAIASAILFSALSLSLFTVLFLSFSLRICEREEKETTRGKREREISRPRGEKEEEDAPEIRSIPRRSPVNEIAESAGGLYDDHEDDYDDDQDECAVIPPLCVRARACVCLHLFFFFLSLRVDDASRTVRTVMMLLADRR